MSNKIIFFIICFLTIETINTQSQILKPAFLNYEIDSLTKHKITISLDSLFSQINAGKVDRSLVGEDEIDLSIFKSFSGIEENKTNNIPNFYKNQLINIYPLSANEYWISLAFIGQKNNEIPVLKSIINLIATTTNSKLVFSIPAKYLTKTWKSQVIGNITYHFRDKINIERAKKFNAKNTIIASKLGLKPEKLNFYMCNNYQEILQLLGYEYDMESNGKTRDGYGVDGNTIFSIMNNEDFSHDVFHYYSGKFRKQPGNGIVEEGIAYSWGNAYYTNKLTGEMIEQKELVQNLKIYLKENPKTDLLELFNKSPKIFTHLATEISVRSTISSLICDEVERKKGIEGIKTLIKCGRGNDNFFMAINELILLNPGNFDKELKKLIAAY